MQRQYTQMGLRHRMVSYGARGPEEPARKALGPAADYIFAGIWWHKDLPYPQVKGSCRSTRRSTSGSRTHGMPPRRTTARAPSPPPSRRPALSTAHWSGTPLRKVRLTDSLLPGKILDFEENGQTVAPFVIVQNKPTAKSISSTRRIPGRARWSPHPAVTPHGTQRPAEPVRRGHPAGGHLHDDVHRNDRDLRGHEDGEPRPRGWHS